jgi:hypothetical protein
MAMTNLVATLVQISDLHIGQIDPRSGNATLNKNYIRMASSFKVLDGLLGHHAAGLEALDRFVAAEKAAAGQGLFRVIVTGDLSRCGAQAELSLAKDYIFGQIDISPPLGNMLGLKLQAHEVIGIPGNHDQWGGNWQPIGGTPSHYAAHDRSQETPYTLRLPLTKERNLVLVGIDSDRNIWPWGIKRLLAVGSFKDELTDHKIAFGSNEVTDVRAFLVHHSLAVRTKTLRMEKSSRTSLERYLTANGFKVVLTGHTHAFSLPAKAGTSGQPFEELRCGSTTQHDQVPYNWVTLTGKAPTRTDWKQNTLLVHRIYEYPALMTWETQAYGRFDGAGFRSLGHQHFVQLVV